MSAFRTPMSAAQPAKGLRPVIKPTTNVPAGDSSTRRSDAEMMYAWSIGVTSAVRTFSENSKPPQEESCPPEVYIG